MARVLPLEWLTGNGPANEGTIRSVRATVDSADLVLAVGKRFVRKECGLQGGND